MAPLIDDVKEDFEPRHASLLSVGKSEKDRLIPMLLLEAFRIAREPLV